MGTVNVEKVLPYLRYCGALKQGKAIDKIASDLGYDSPQALYKGLAQKGFPVCESCGATPKSQDHCEPPAKKKRRAKSTNGGEVVGLPPVREAIPLFRQIIGLPSRFLDGSMYSYVTERGLHGFAEDLRDLEEELHGKRFVSNKVFRPEDGVGFEGTLRRNDYSEEEWQEICESLDQDHSFTDEITPYDVPGGPSMTPLGAGKTPSKGLVVLIAVYALVRQDFGPLVEKLHPDPASVDTEQLRSLRVELQRAAEHVATVVRGGHVGKGAPTEGLSPKEVHVAYMIADLKKEGLSYDEIRERLRGYRIDLSRAEVERLGALNLSRPDH